MKPGPKKKVKPESVSVDTTELKHPVSENVEEHKEIISEAKAKKEEGILKEKEKDKKKEPAPLEPGFKYFEAPDGTLIIGEADKQQVWYRAGNGGKGCFINPKR